MTYSPHKHLRSTTTLYLLVALFSGLVLAGCDSAGSEVNAEDDFTLAVVSEETSFTPGSAVELAVSHASVPTSGEIALSARVGETDVLLAPVRQDTLAFFVPAVAAGQHTMTVDFEDLTAEVPFTVAAYDQIEDPAAYVASEVEGLYVSLGAMIEAETDPAVRSHFQAQQEDLDDALVEWAELPAEQQAMVAYYVRETVRSAETVTAKAVHADTECISDDFAAELAQLTAGGVFAAWMTGGGLTLLKAGQPWWAAAAGVLGAVGGAVALEAVLDLKDMVPAVLECVFAQAMRMVDESAAMKAHGGASMAVISVTHGVSKTLAVETGFALQEAAASLLAEADALMHEYADYVPDVWLNAFDAPEDLVWEPGAPDDLALSSISDSGIWGTLEVSGDEVVLAFSYIDDENQLEEAQDFTFILGFGEETAEFEASLVPRLCWDASGFPGDWNIIFSKGENQLSIRVHSDGTVGSSGYSTWTFYCHSNLLVVDFRGGRASGWWARSPYHFWPDLGSTDSIHGEFTGTGTEVQLVRQ